MVDALGADGDDDHASHSEGRVAAKLAANGDTPASLAQPRRLNWRGSTHEPHEGDGDRCATSAFWHEDSPYHAQLRHDSIRLARAPAESAVGF